MLYFVIEFSSRRGARVDKKELIFFFIRSTSGVTHVSRFSGTSDRRTTVERFWHRFVIIYLGEGPERSIGLPC